MDRVLDIVSNETNGRCYTSFRYCVDEEIRVPTLDFDTKIKEISIQVGAYGESDTNLLTSKNLKALADKISLDEPLFQFFLDGSRRTYKVDDLEINRNVFPIIAGQIGVACCQRVSRHQFKSVKDGFEHNLVLSLPKAANPNAGDASLFFNALTTKLNKTKRIEKAGIKFSKILSYDSKKQDDGKKYEHLAIATIQDEMIDTEMKIVAHLSTKNLINPDRYLIKDGSLQYKPMRTNNIRELTKIKNHYKCAIGVSKMFNPELCQDRSGKSNADKIAQLPLYHRTPAMKYRSNFIEKVSFAIWYVRIREAKRTASPFAGVLKIEKILITEDENDNGLNSEEIDLITANIINERNPVCYGKDSRWANHIYPVYLTESFIKSKYLSDINFLNLF